MPTLIFSVELLRSVLLAIEDILVDPILVFSGRGFSLHAYGLEELALVSVDLMSKEFDPTLGDRTIPMRRLDLDELANYIKSGGIYDGIVTVRILEDRKILWCKTGNLPSPLEMSYDEILNFDVEEYQLEEVDEYDAIVKLPATMFGVLIGQILILDDPPDTIKTVEISATHNYIQLSGKGFLHLYSKEVTSFVKRPVSVACHLELLDWASQVCHITDSDSIGYGSRTVTLSLHPRFPIKVEYNIADKHTIRYYLVRSRTTR